MSDEDENGKSEPFVPEDTSMDEGKTCSICFDDYTNAGNHRLVCLLCGHLFGQRCIEKWLSTSKNGRGKCPKCKRKATKKDIRRLYAKGIQMIDTTEKEEALRKVETLKQQNRELELQLAAANLKAQKEREEAQKMLRSAAKRPRISSADQPCTSTSGFDPAVFPTDMTILPCPSPVPTNVSVGLTPRSVVEVCSKESSRAMSYCKYLGQVVATCQSPNNLWQGYGLRKVNLAEGRATDYLHVHLARPRDVKYSPVNDGLVLSTGEDKWLRISSVHTNNTINGFQLPSQGWCCAWKEGAPHYVFAGLMNGLVYLYDTRMMSERRTVSTPGDDAVCEVTGRINGLPVTHLQYIQSASNANASSSGLLVTKLNQCLFFESTEPTQFKAHLLPLEGQLTSVSYETTTNHFLATFRPSKHHRVVTHQLYSMDYENSSLDPTIIESHYSASHVQTFQGGLSQQHMTRNSLFKHPFSNDRCLAAVYDEQNSNLKLFDTSNGLEKAVLRLNAKNVMQIEYLSREKEFVGLLTQQKLHLMEMLRT